MKPHTEIVIANHDPARFPLLRRAVASVLAEPGTRVVIVAHNLPATQVREKCVEVTTDAFTVDPQRVTVVELHGHEGKPGAAFDAGIKATSAEWVGIMGSDDTYSEGALTRMHARARHDDADIVIAPLYRQGKRHATILPTRGNRRLQAAQNRLFYRTAPLGIIRGDIFRQERFRFGDRFVTGEDMVVSARLWTSGFSVSLYQNDPPYVVGNDAPSRASQDMRHMSVTGDAWHSALALADIEGWDDVVRHAFAVKMVRIHICDAIRVRQERPWLDGEEEWLSDYIERLLSVDPRVMRALPDGEQAVFERIRQRRWVSLSHEQRAELFTAQQTLTWGEKVRLMSEPDSLYRWNTTQNLLTVNGWKRRLDVRRWKKR